MCHMFRLEELKPWISNISVAVLCHICHVEIGKSTGGGAGAEVVKCYVNDISSVKAQDDVKMWKTMWCVRAAVAHLNSGLFSQASMLFTSALVRIFPSELGFTPNNHNRTPENESQNVHFNRYKGGRCSHLTASSSYSCSKSQAQHREPGANRTFRLTTRFQLFSSCARSWFEHQRRWIWAESTDGSIGLSLIVTEDGIRSVFTSLSHQNPQSLWLTQTKWRFVQVGGGSKVPSALFISRKIVRGLSLWE